MIRREIPIPARMTKDAYEALKLVVRQWETSTNRPQPEKLAMWEESASKRSNGVPESIILYRDRI